MDAQSKIDKLEAIGFELMESTEISDYDRWMNNAIELEEIRRYIDALSCCNYLLDTFPNKSFEIYKRMVTIEEEYAQWSREHDDWIENDNSIWHAYRCLRLAGYNRYEFSKIKKRLMANLSEVARKKF